MPPWRILWAEPGAEGDLAPALAALARNATPEGAEAVKRNPVRQVLRVPLAGDEGAYLKWEVGAGPVRSWRARLGLAATRQEAANLRSLRRHGIAAVEPLLCAERWVGGRHHGLLATRELAGASGLRRALDRGSEPERKRWLGALMGLARRLHEAGFWHRDLHAGNALLSAEPEEVVLVDVQKLRRWPGALPAGLRARDLGLLADDLATTTHPPRLEELIDAYAAAGAPLADRDALLARTAAAAQRRRWRRLRSRGARCLRPSSGFRVERQGSLRVYRREDVPAETVREALARHRGRCEAMTRQGDLPGGPPPGRPPRLPARGHGRPEPGAPARAAITVREFRLAPRERWMAGFGVPPAARRAWVGAHALLLRGFDTPAPLALVEDAGWTGGERSWCLVRDEPDLQPWEGDAAERDAFADRLLDAGVRHGSGLVRVTRRAGGGPVIETPEALRFAFGRAPSSADRARLRAALSADQSIG